MNYKGDSFHDERHDEEWKEDLKNYLHVNN